ncbi:sodium:proton exchanger [Candidatus Campbellbacteria bacterium CG22_combo_CG10-13_8_21_14_all_36_13]|uniref:Sodium:proton exchanger n=1 Tax=Candidatus Campbellbacteria bacterium CG22_combo_CG10-13_8_21_14_all_36_13 TaxID=1974529 RepID=A0A2H0DYM5_9BACT|nr:MAG: sodium:proton exchanger [Candidatus Campbellbacteria bacterium CG22_combo_CG10-13_8_21_14_all_36_13]
MDYILLILGIVVLLKGADYLVSGSSAIAKKFGVSSLIIGFTVVAFGTSVPDLVVSIVAALDGQVGTVFGNVIGSNIANILLILGVIAIIKPLNIKKTTALREILFSLLAAIVLLLISNNFILGGSSDSFLTRIDGLILLLFFVVFLFYFMSPKKTSKIPTEGFKQRHNIWKEIWVIIFGVIGLYLGSKWTVESVSSIALSFGVSDFLIASTAVALGTSLPELITSVKAATRKESDLAIGNVIGSNIFNIFGVLGITFVIAPIEIQKLINIDILFLIFITMLLLSFVFIGKKYKLERWHGILFIVFYVLYIIFLLLRG